MNGFLPLTIEEMKALGWDRPDFCLVTGDGYIDHPSFGAAVIARALEHEGFKVAIIAQPDWHDIKEFSRFGKPRLGFFVTAGNLDSMVAHYTVNKKKRRDDAYTPGGLAGRRPDRACIVYTNRIREAYGDIPIVLGGIEASLRRFAHYDYWDDRVRHSVLVDAGADLLVYGMGEKPAVRIANLLAQGVPVREIRDVAGTVYRTLSLQGVDALDMPGHQEVCQDKHAFNAAFMMQQEENDGMRGRALAQRFEKGYVVANPPPKPMTMQEMDAVYALPYMRDQHPGHRLPIPALSEALFSLTSCRGCFGGCSFCALNYHQGRTVQVRSHASLLDEAKIMTQDGRFKGYIHDVGGPTANFRQPSCHEQMKKGVCKNKPCLVPKCENLKVSHHDYLMLLRKLRALPKVKKVFVRSGIRYDYVMYDRDKQFLEELLMHHVSGQLRVAPEHTAPTVLHLMGKPEDNIYERFCQRFNAIVENNAMDIYLVPYFMSSHPGSNLDAAIALACEMKKTGQRPEQVQDFYPTPGTLSTAMFHTGLDPRDNREVYVPRSMEEKNMQRALLQYFMPQNAPLVRRALKIAGREDLIGLDEHCLVKPAFAQQTEQRAQGKRAGSKRQTAFASRENAKRAEQGAKAGGTKPKTRQNGRADGVHGGEGAPPPGRGNANAKSAGRREGLHTKPAQRKDGAHAKPPKKDAKNTRTRQQGRDDVNDGPVQEKNTKQRKHKAL